MSMTGVLKVADFPPGLRDSVRAFAGRFGRTPRTVQELAQWEEYGRPVPYSSADHLTVGGDYPLALAELIEACMADRGVTVDALHSVCDQVLGRGRADHRMTRKVMNQVGVALWHLGLRVVPITPDDATPAATPDFSLEKRLLDRLNASGRSGASIAALAARTEGRTTADYLRVNGRLKQLAAAGHAERFLDDATGRVLWRITAAGVALDGDYREKEAANG